MPQEDRSKIFEWTNAMAGGDDPEFADNVRGTAMRDLFAYVNALATERHAAPPRDDIVTTLLNAEVHGDTLSELEFDMFMLVLATAGSESTRNTTTHGMHALLKHPEQLQWLRDDLDGRIGVAVEEVLRWSSPCCTSDGLLPKTSSCGAERFVLVTP